MWVFKMGPFCNIDESESRNSFNSRYAISDLSCNSLMMQVCYAVILEKWILLERCNVSVDVDMQNIIQNKRTA